MANNKDREIKLHYWVGVVVSKPQDKRNTYPLDFSEMLSSFCSFLITFVCSRCLSFNPSFVLRGIGGVGGWGGNDKSRCEQSHTSCPNEETLKSTLGFRGDTKCNGFPLMMLILPIKCCLGCLRINWGEGCTLNIDWSVQTEFLKCL